MADPSRCENLPPAAAPFDRSAAPWLILCVAVAVTVTIVAPRVWLVLLSEGMYVVALLAAAAGWGAWPMAWLGFVPRRRAQQVCLALGLGLGILGLLTLALGLCGLLSGRLAWTLLAVGGGLGLWRVYAGQDSPNVRAPRERDTKSEQSASQRLSIPTAAQAGRPCHKRTTQAGRLSHSGGAAQIALRTLALATLVPAASIALFGATLPPGILWPAEAGGYDALEYHLQAPREYYEAGQIHFLPHNVYASFPQQMEMHYLLLMHLTGDLNRAAVAAQILHGCCGLLAIIALAVWQPRGWPAITTTIAAAGVAWLAYLGCLAYVELGVLFFAALAVGLVVDQIEHERAFNWRAALATGVFAGLAAGCKYTALALVAAALAVAWALTMRGTARSRMRPLGLYALGVALAFSPWMFRNFVFTGNPVFPFAYEWFSGSMPAGIWSAEQAAQWDAGHRFKAEGGGLTARARAATSELLLSPMFGPGLFLAVIAGAIGRRSRVTVMIVIWTVLMIAIWGLTTHIPGRFIVPVVIPLAFLAGGMWNLQRRMIPPVVTGLVAAWALFGSSTVLLKEMRASATRMGSALREWVGMTDVMSERRNYVNRAVPSGAHVRLIGDAAVFYVRRRFEYTVVFNRDPWIEYAGGEVSPADCVNWLRRRGVTHVLFFWPEIERLRRTYGFSAIVTPAWVRGLAEAGLVSVPDSGLPDGFLFKVSGP